MGIRFADVEGFEYTAHLLAVGEVVEGEIGDAAYAGVFLRTFDGLVNLTSPNQTWRFSANTGTDPLTIKGKLVDVELRVKR